jgi:hypothetical protein
MKYIQDSSVPELKEKYSEHHGFIFKSSNKSSDRSIESLAGILKNQGITKEFPVLVAKLDHGIVFVYEDFDGPRFWQIADHARAFMGLDIQPLCFFLNGAEG